MLQYCLFRKYEKGIKWIKQWSLGSQAPSWSAWTLKTDPSLNVPTESHYFPSTFLFPTNVLFIEYPFFSLLILECSLLYVTYMKHPSFIQRVLLTNDLENPTGVNLIWQMWEKSKSLHHLQVSEEYLGRIRTFMESVWYFPILLWSTKVSRIKAAMLYQVSYVLHNMLSVFQTLCLLILMKMFLWFIIVCLLYRCEDQNLKFKLFARHRANRRLTWISKSSSSDSKAHVIEII